MYLEMKLTGPFAPLSPLNPQELLGLLKQYVLMSPWLGRDDSQRGRLSMEPPAPPRLQSAAFGRADVALITVSFYPQAHCQICFTLDRSLSSCSALREQFLSQEQRRETT